MDTITVQVPAEAGYIPVLRSAVSGVGAQMNFGVDQIEDLRLATTEVCSYLLRIAPAAGAVTLAIRPREGAVTVEATADDPVGELPADGVEQFITWHLLEALTDQASIEWMPGGPTLRFSKGRFREIG